MDIIAYSDIINEPNCSHTVRESVKDLLDKAAAAAAAAEAAACKGCRRKRGIRMEGFAS
jgi:hypothetical protein